MVFRKEERPHWIADPHGAGDRVVENQAERFVLVIGNVHASGCRIGGNRSRTPADGDVG